MSSDSDNKTEQPTERRRRMAREQGLGPRSADLTVACRMIGVAVALQWFGSRLVNDLAASLSSRLQPLDLSDLTVHKIVAQSWDVVSQLGLNMIGAIACVLVGGLFSQWAQVGFRMEPAEVLPDLSRLSPVRGIGRLWRFENSQQAFFGLLKYLLVLFIGGWCVWSRLDRLMQLQETEASVIGESLGQALATLSWQLAGLLLVMGLADYGIQYWRFEQSLKMSTEEIREEARQQSGPTHWKQQRRELWSRATRDDAIASVEAQ